MTRIMLLGLDFTLDTQWWIEVRRPSKSMIKRAYIEG